MVLEVRGVGGPGGVVEREEDDPRAGPHGRGLGRDLDARHQHLAAAAALHQVARGGGAERAQQRDVGPDHALARVEPEHLQLGAQARPRSSRAGRRGPPLGRVAEVEVVGTAGRPPRRRPPAPATAAPPPRAHRGDDPHRDAARRGGVRRGSSSAVRAEALLEGLGGGLAAGGSAASGREPGASSSSASERDQRVEVGDLEQQVALVRWCRGRTGSVLLSPCSASSAPVSTSRSVTGLLGRARCHRSASERYG